MSTGVDPVDDAKSLSGETLCDTEYRHSILDDHSGTTDLRRFKSTSSEMIFVVSVSISRSLCGYSLIGFPALLPTLDDTFHLEGASSTWLVSVVPLVLSTFFLPFRRLAERFGILPVFQCGLAWTLIWTLFAGTSTSHVMLTVCRAMQGLGGAAHFLSGAALLSSLYSPGVPRDRAFFLYESMELLGSFLGIFVAGLSSQYLSWRWYFWVAAVLTLQALVGSSFTAPESIKGCGKNAKIPMDWLGCITTISALTLTVCWVIELPHAPQGWQTPYLLATEVLSIASLGFAIYVEGWVAEKPLLPLEILEIRGVEPLLVGLFFGYGAIGIYVLYAIL
jgi:MFS family permease